jgi:hypothetical protein
MAEIHAVIDPALETHDPLVRALCQRSLQGPPAILHGEMIKFPNGLSLLRGVLAHADCDQEHRQSERPARSRGVVRPGLHPTPPPPGHLDGLLGVAAMS